MTAGDEDKTNVRREDTKTRRKTRRRGSWFDVKHLRFSFFVTCFVPSCLRGALATRHGEGCVAAAPGGVGCAGGADGDACQMEKRCRGSMPCASGTRLSA